MSNHERLLFIGLGSNLGDREKKLQEAKVSLEQYLGKVVCESSIAETSPEGYASDNQYFNQVVAVKTSLDAEECLLISQQIEKSLGRCEKTLRVGDYSDRSIDLDLLLFDNGETCSLPHLQIPHPRLVERVFVLRHLEEVAPELEHPTERRSITFLLKELERGRQASYRTVTRVAP